MSDDQRIFCKKCSKKITPRLWHKHRGLLLKDKLHHICPYCGSIQYKTGGGLSIFSWVLISSVVAFNSYALLNAPSEAERETQTRKYEKNQQQARDSMAIANKSNRLTILDKSKKTYTKRINELTNAVNEMKISLNKENNKHLQKRVDEYSTQIDTIKMQLEDVNSEILSLRK